MKPCEFKHCYLLLSFCLVGGSWRIGAATATWTNVAGGSWNTAANWSPNQVPGAEDTAVIAIEGADKALTVLLDADITVAGLSLGSAGSCAGPQSLYLNGKTLTLNGPLSIGDCGLFNLDSGVLMGGNLAVVSGVVTWSGGVLNGTLTVATNGVLVLTGPAAGFHGLYGALTNFGLVRVTGGDLEFQGNYTGMLINKQAGVVDIQTNLNISSYNNRGTFYNWGLLRQSGGTGTTTVRPHFYNYGQVDCQSGTMLFLGGGEFNDGSSIGGSAVAQLADGVYSLNGTVKGTGAILSGASLTGSNGVLSGQWIWTDGNFGAASTLTVGSDGQLKLAGATGADEVLYGILTNAGRIQLTSGNLICQGNLQGLLINLPGAVVELTDDVSVYNYNNGGALLNWGTVRKSGGNGISTMRLAFYNHGIAEVQTGTVVYSGPTTLLDGGSRMAGTGTNLVTAGTIWLNGAFEAQNLVLSGNTVRDNGSFTGKLYWTAGRLEDGASLTVLTNATLELAGPDQKVIVGLLINHGTLLCSGTGRLAMGSLSAMAAIDNRVGATFELASDAAIAWTGYSQPAVTNAGIVRKTATAGTSVFDHVIFHNTGTVDVQAGTVSYTATGSSFEDGSRLTGNGTNLLASGVIELSGAIYAENLEFGGATITGSSMLSGKIYWSRGTIEDGTVVGIAHNGQLVIEGPDEKGCLGLLDNSGAIFVYGTGRVAFGFKSGPLVLNNRTGALFDLVNDTPIAWTGWSQPTFTNSGLFRKSGGTGTVALDGIIFGNSGTVNVQTGTLLFNASGSIFGDGTSFLGRGTNLLAAGAIQLSGQIYSENLELGGATILGTNTLSGSIYWSKGEVRYDSSVTIVPDAMLTIGGTELKGLTGSIDNLGTIRVTGTGTFGLGSRSGLAWISNHQSGLFDLAGDTPVYWTAFDQPTFTNSGVFRKSAGSGTSSLTGIIFHNDGIVATEVGTVGFNTTGSIFGEGTRFIGSGTNLLYGGSITLSGSIHSQNLVIAGAGLLGTNFLSGDVTWRSGSILSTAVLTVTSNSTLHIDGPDQKGITGVLNNQGRILLAGIGTLALGSQKTLAVIQNQPGATFEATGDAPIAWTAYDQPFFTNAGTFRRTGRGTTSINLAFMNPGTLDIQGGAVTLADGYDLSGGRLNFGLAGLTNYGRLSIASGAFLRGTISAECLGGYQPAAGNSFAVLAFNSRNGAFDHEEFPSCAAWQTIYDTTTTSLKVLNARPTLAELPPQRVDELRTLTATNVATHADGEAQNLTFGLDTSPQGMKIDPGSGVITWTPAQSQSPSTNLVRVFVTDNGTPALSSTNSFLVVVREVNVAPVLPGIAPQTIYELTRLTVTNSATESNIHSVTSGYRLENAPAGMMIGADGVVSWVPSHSQAPGTNLVVTVVSNSNPYDFVHPILDATNQFMVVVYEKPQLTGPSVSAGGSFQFTFITISGETYTVQYSTNLDNWVSMSTFEGFGGPLTIKDPSWSQRSACYYRLQVVR